MGFKKLLLSKWFYYGLIAVVLVSLSVYLLPSAWKGDAMAANFVTEIWGLIFTLFIFVMLFEMREKLE